MYVADRAPSDLWLRAHVLDTDTFWYCVLNDTDPPVGEWITYDITFEYEDGVWLMGTDPSAKPFFDLDIGVAEEWFIIEKIACKQGLDFDERSVDGIKISKSTKRAYRLVGLIRQAAKGFSDLDVEGCHYFAELLFWTLDILKEHPVRRAKKLLALYSASEILNRFDAYTVGVNP